MRKLDVKKFISAVGIAIIFFFIGYWFGGPLVKGIINLI